MKSNGQCNHRKNNCSALYINLTFVHRAKNKEVWRCASENDIDETL